MTVVTFDEAKELAGRDLGFTEYRTVDQHRVNTFADATDDHQWIHTDPERAKDGPFGAPIAQASCRCPWRSRCGASCWTSRT